MRLEALRSNVLMFVGNDHESVATAFLDDDDVLLVDSLGSMEDARWLRRVLCEDMAKTVCVVAATHFMSDHIAGMSLFPDALTIAHRHHRHTFLSQNRRVDAFYREPRVVFDSAMAIRWGGTSCISCITPARPWTTSAWTCPPPTWCVPATTSSATSFTSRKRTLR